MARSPGSRRGCITLVRVARRASGGRIRFVCSGKRPSPAYEATAVPAPRGPHPPAKPPISRRPPFASAAARKKYSVPRSAALVVLTRFSAREPCGRHAETPPRTGDALRRAEVAPRQSGHRGYAKRQRRVLEHGQI